nr:hypothetical protein [Tanacetum cinerariifolium]
ERRNKLKASKLRRLKKVGTTQKVETSDDTVMDDVSKQERIIADMDADKDVTLKDVAAVVKDVQDTEIEEKPAELQEVVEVVTTAKLIIEVVTAATTTITVAAPQLTTAAALTLTTAPSAARRRKGVVIKYPKESATPSIIIHTEAKSKDKGKRIMKEDNAVKRYQALKRKPQTEAQAKKNMMIYLRNKFNSNVAFLQKTKEQREEEDSRALKRLSETQEEKAASKQKLDEELTELKRHLEICPMIKMMSTLKLHLLLTRRRYALSSNTNCFALSSVEGRVAIGFFYLSEAGQSKKYIFKCHKKSEGERDIVYPVNTIAFHPTRHKSKEQSLRAKRGNGIPPAIVPAGTSEEKPVPVVA